MEIWLSIVGLVIVAMGVLAITVWVSARVAERRHPPVGQFLEIDGVRLRYVDRGDGPALVLLHGNGTMIEDFTSSGLFDLAARQYRVIAFDRPGFGYSNRPRGRSWTPDRQAELLWAAFTKLGIVNPLVMGHSWGTLVTLALAFRHPEQLRGIVLMSGYYFPTPRLDVPVLSTPAIPVLGDIMRYTISPLLSWLMLGKIIGRLFEPQPVPERFRAGFPASLTLRPWQLRAAAEEAALMWPAARAFSESYSGTRVPTVIIVGSDDRVIDRERQSARLHQEIAGSRYLVIRGGGHMVHHRDPESVLQAVSSVVGWPAVERRRAQR